MHLQVSARATAELFCREGAKVVAVARREERLRDLAEECSELPGEIIWHAGDVGDPATAVKHGKKKQWRHSENWISP